MPFCANNELVRSTDSLWLQNIIEERLPKKQMSLNNVSILSLSVDKTVCILKAFARSLSERKFRRTASATPANSGISTASVADVRIRFFAKGKDLTIYETS